MRFAFHNLAMVMWLFCTLSLSMATSGQFNTIPINNAQGLNAILQTQAYHSFLRPRTGVVYDGTVPSNLTGIQISAVRLRSGSLRKKGFIMNNEIQIPTGVVVHPFVERLVLVYHNLGNWSNTFYPLKNYTYLAPVLGLLAYNASDLTANNLPELQIHATDQPISIRFPGPRPPPNGAVPKCITFYSNRSVSLSNVSSDFICTAFEQGHYSIVAESIAHPFPVINATKRGPMQIGNAENRYDWKVGVIIGSVLGGIAVLAVLGLLVVQVSKYNYRKRMDHMERAAEIGEDLKMANVGGTKAPAASGTRTHPKLESEFMA